MKKSLYIIVLCVFFLTFFAGCSQSGGIATLEKKEIFTLDYGNFENQLNIFDISSVNDINTSLVMRNGFFYIMNSEALKIMEMSSYGDLITFYYNPQRNKAPSYAEADNAKSATRRAVEYEFNELSAITVDSRKYLYAVDKFPFDRQDQDSENGQVLSQIVLRFNSEGKYMDYIGQQGPGGMPFPYIKSIHATNDNELVVITYSNENYTIYWFSSDGYLLYKMPVYKQNVPSPFESGDASKSWHSISNIVPDYNERMLYLKIDFYSSTIDEASHLQSGIMFNGTYIYSLNIEDGKFGEPLEILPYTEQNTEGFSNERYEIPYDFLGITENGWFFFFINTDSGFNVQMIQRDGQRILKRNLPINRKDILYYSLDLSNNGILSALFIKNDRAEIDWWRTDSLIQSVLKN
ncbi:MAG: hypothetical protein K6G00_12160 [Treponema sp.]|nr:hypothetical protein [Treponema sp.]